MPQIDGTISKKTILLYKNVTQRYLDRLVDSIGFAIYDSTITRLLSLLLLLLSLCFHTLSVTLCHSLLPSFFIYPNVRHISELSANRYILSYNLDKLRRPASVNGFFRASPLVAMCPETRIHASASLIISFLYVSPLIILFFYSILGHPASISVPDIYQLLLS